MDSHARFDKQTKEIDPAKPKDLVLQLKKLAIPTTSRLSRVGARRDMATMPT